jgi:Coenzyme PQQ synthesis protein D (PqqD)
MARRTDRPNARTRGVVTKAVDDEILVYDLTRHRAHALNQPAAAVWRQCDGIRTAPEIAAATRADGVPLSEAVVRYAISELDRAHLLTTSGPDSRLSRREWLRRFGVATAVALPAVTSIAAPTAAEAQSIVCRDANQPCTSAAQCCAGACAQFSCTCESLGGGLICVT